MVWNAADIQEGMQVLGLDGHRVGTVTRVWLDVSDSKSLSNSALGHSAAHGLMPLEFASGSMTVKGGYFSVESADGEGGRQRLFIPFSAVQILFPGQNVTLSCSFHECRAQFAERPESIFDVGNPRASRSA